MYSRLAASRLRDALVKSLLWMLICIFVGSVSYGSGDQANPEILSAFERSPLSFNRIDDNVNVRIDGVVGTNEWKSATEITDLRLVNRDQDDMPPSNLHTSVKVFYNDRGLYVSFDMEQNEETFVKIHSAPDGGSLSRDFVTIALDTSGEGKYGSYFTLFLGGSKRDGSLSPERNWRSNWDGAWYGRTSHSKEGWAAEFLIPWSILNMPHSAESRNLGLLVSRNIAGVGEYYSWPAIHDNAPKFLSDLRPVVVRDIKQRQQLSIFPFVATNIDNVNDTSREQYGADLFWRPSSNFQLTATALPDFGTVEANDVIINLTAFETFFPDKRLFFIENREIFLSSRLLGGGSGSPVPFHSRRIGDRPSYPQIPEGVELDLSPLSQGADLLGAAKGVGQIGSIRYGVLGAIEDDTTFRGTKDGEPFSLTVPGRDFGVMRVLYENTTSGMFGLGVLSTARRDASYGNAFTHTVDWRLRSEDGRVAMGSQFFTSNVENQEDGYGGLLDIAYQANDKIRHYVSVQSIDDKLDLRAMGYVFRNDQTSVSYGMDIVEYATKRFQSVFTNFDVTGIWNADGDRTATSLKLSRGVTTHSLGGLYGSFQFSPSYLDDSTAYRVASFKTRPNYRAFIDWVSDDSRKFYYSVWYGAQTDRVKGKFLTSGIRLVFQPIESFRLNM